MVFSDVLLKKRNGNRLTKDEIDFSISGFVSGKIPDYQFSALLMAIYFKGLDKEETLLLTKAMIASGEVIDLSSVSGIKVDKHSTGGVGDKTTIIVGPLVASAGVKMAKLSGRGLGHTGGTIDKLEAIPGFSVDMSRKKFIKNINKVGIAIGGQTKELVPADKMIYALRDVTCTVDNISLIASSVMSKKIVSGADCIILDVKVGDGAFMKNTKNAFELAKEMVDIGKKLGKKTAALITNMNEPLGNAIGNALEVNEAMKTLKGNGPEDLHTLCIEISAQMLLAAGLYKREKDAVEYLQECISSGRAFKKFLDFIQVQGGDIKSIENSDLPLSKYDKSVLADRGGYITKISAMTVGLASVMTGAGRETKTSPIDLGAGILLNKKVGDFVKKGEVIATLYSNNKLKLDRASGELLSAYQFSNHKPKKNKLIYGMVS